MKRSGNTLGSFRANIFCSFQFPTPTCYFSGSYHFIYFSSFTFSSEGYTETRRPVRSCVAKRSRQTNTTSSLTFVLFEAKRKSYRSLSKTLKPTEAYNKRCESIPSFFNQKQDLKLLFTKK